MDQKIQNINVKDLILWTENPRDPISSTAKDQDVADRAINDPNSKWNLNKLAKEMGEYYDFSEIPIVVYKNGKPIVYDGNRRVLLAKIKLGYVLANDLKVNLPEVPIALPCNVCEENIALTSIYRKHVRLKNTWDPIERDIFATKYLGENKSIFLLFDEATNGYITKNPVLNQGFVKKEILTETLLDSLGFSFIDKHLQTKHTDKEVNVILNDLLQKIKNKEITTRLSRGKPFSILDQRTKEIIKENRNKKYHPYVPTETIKGTENFENSNPRKTPITHKNEQILFGEKLILKKGTVNNLYSDIVSLYDYVNSTQKAFSPDVYKIFRMSLRLLCETAAKDININIDEYIKKYFSQAKKELDKDIKTSMSSQNVKEENLPQLFQAGAHGYTSSASKDQMLAISFALGAMLKISHGKQ